MRLPPRAKPARGFTLIEMLVVLVILGLSIALILARGPAQSGGFDLQSAAETVAQQLRLARSEAIATDRITTFTGNTALPPEVAMAMTTATGGKPRPLRAISFAPDGSSSGGRVVLIARGHERQILVDWLTGRISLADAP